MRTWLVVAALTIAGCSSEAADDRSAGDAVVTSTSLVLDPAEPASPFELDDETIEEIGSAVREPTPLAEFFAAYDTIDKTPNEIEEELASCMARQGFDYSPFVYDVEPDPRSNDEYLINATLGYAITTMLGREPILIADTGLLDPNEEIYGALSPEERRAYDRVIGDCQVEVGQVPSEEQVVALDVISDEVGDLYDEVQERIDADPDVAAERAAWRTCMADAGFAYRSREEIHAEFIQEAERFIASAPELLGGGLLAEDLPEEQRVELDELQTRERTIALADLGCRPALDEALHAARVSVEQAMLDGESERLDRLALSIAELRAG